MSFYELYSFIKDQLVKEAKQVSTIPTV